MPGHNVLICRRLNVGATRCGFFVRRAAARFFGLTCDGGSGLCVLCHHGSLTAAHSAKGGFGWDHGASDERPTFRRNTIGINNRVRREHCTSKDGHPSPHPSDRGRGCALRVRRRSILHPRPATVRAADPRNLSCDPLLRRRPGGSRRSLTLERPLRRRYTPCDDTTLR